MGGSNFELLMQEVFNQKQCMEQLLEENEDLQRQLADLRAGRGIFLEICGKQFALNGGIIGATPPPVSPIQDSPAIDQPTINMALNQPSAIDQPTINMGLTQPPRGTIPETPLPSTDEFEPLPEDSEQSEEVAAPTPTPSFLEEMLIDELAAAATTPMTAWKGSETKKLPAIDEDENAVLRRELIGSFLLG
jgi:hypothetical protein